ncbi:cupin domain-containing protein [Francisella sp. SYW-9]|uniref:cupin domain-containing protein n=1 Tax=Francisella sp. SYW-9 TaxID=2610888 RepID=UPI00123C9361|nr:cupin domain-containing protein [Francisella sp. SYW-9]
MTLENVSSTLRSRILRNAELEPCKTAFIDAKTPGSDQKENFCLIGGGVSENPGQVTHIKIPHGFDVGAARQPKGCKNSHHTHDTEEIFVVHKGSWKFSWGHDGSDGYVVLNAGDTISLPTAVFRGFENVGDGDNFLFCILGQKIDGTAGKVTWPPYVFENAKDHGLVLLEGGRLIDTSSGEKIPEGAKLMRATTDEDVAKYKPFSHADIAKGVLLESELTDQICETGGLNSIEGVSEIPVIGLQNANESLNKGKIDWSHNFVLRRLRLESGAIVPEHKRFEEEVLFVHKGSLHVKTSEGEFDLHEGDLFTCPIELMREYSNIANEKVDVIVARRGDNPKAAEFK